MPPDQQFDFNKASGKKWVDRFMYGMSDNGLTHISFASGSETHTFVFDAILAKKIARGLLQGVEMIEKKMGTKLDDRLDNDPLPSPLSGEMRPPESGGKPKNSK